MKNKWLKRGIWILFTPVVLFGLLIVLLYVPPVQSFLRQQVTAAASEATGMHITIDRIDLRFPLNLLVRGVLVTQPADSPDEQRQDTILRLQSLNVRVQAWPLLHGQVEVDEVRLKQVAVNSMQLVDGVQVKGNLGSFFFESHGVDLSAEDAILNQILLENTHLQVMLADTTVQEPDTTATDLNWKIALQRLRLKNVSVDLSMPLDSMNLAAHLGQLNLDDVAVDLKHQFYGWKKFLLSESSLRYDVGSGQPAEGFDASHIALRDIRLSLDSVLTFGRHLHARLRECSMNERSGLSITSLTGELKADTSLIQIPDLKLITPHSEMTFKGQTYWKLVDIPTTGRLSARFMAQIGKQDILLFAGGLPEAFKEAYPFRPLVIQAGTEGNLKQMQISGFTAELPGAFSLKGEGELWHLTEDASRNGALSFEMKTHNLNFLTCLTGSQPDGSLVIPDSMDVTAKVSMEGTRYAAMMKLHEQQGSLDLDASYDTSTEQYEARFLVDSLQIHHFLPKDSIYLLTAQVLAKGVGVDPASARTSATLKASLGELQYGSLKLSQVNLEGTLKSALAKVRMKSQNPLLQMQADASMRLDRNYLDGALKLSVDDIDLHRLRLISKPLEHPLAFDLQAMARYDSLRLSLHAGDLDFRFQAQTHLNHLLQQSNHFLSVLTRQLEERRLNHAALRAALPTGGLYLQAGKQNPVGDYLATQQIRYEDMHLSFGFTPQQGINGRTAIHGFRMDSLQLDTLYFTVRQDTALMKLQGGVINGPKNPQVVFRSAITGEIRSEDAELRAEYTDGQGNTGLLFGIQARPLTEGHGKGNGLLLQLTPQEPIIAFRQFRFAKDCNWIYLHKDMRVYANVDMNSDNGMGFRMMSDPSDTLSLQNMNVEISRFRLSELTGIMPYMPRLTGLLSVEAHYIQDEKALQVSAEANVRQLTYEKQPVGDLGMGVTWLPDAQKNHYFNAYMTVDGQEALLVDGKMEPDARLEALGSLQHFPLRIANAFVPDQMMALGGDLDGEIQVEGTLDQPLVNGELVLDSVSVYARQVGARYWFDNRPVQIKDNRLLFDKFAIYTTSPNPFTVHGNVDFRDLSVPKAHLELKARNYTLLDAPRTRESLVYGKVFVDLNATLRGRLDALVMRGNMNLLGNTNVTYVLTDSPLTVEDRLDGLVSFTSFADTAQVDSVSVPAMSLGGMDMVMTVHIDNAVQVRADLSQDRSKYVQLEGGGDLSLQYTPQGDVNLSGRYTLSGGVMKYSLPVIPDKEFSFVSGSYVDWRGDPMNPTLNLKAVESVRASVAEGDDGSSRMVNFLASISIKNRLEAPELIFDIEAPEDATVQNELQSMGAEERSKQAIAMLATGIYLNSGIKGGGLTMGTALNSVLQSQINALAGSALESVGASFSVGVEDRTQSETGEKQTDYSFRYSQRFFNDRFQIVIGGKVSTGANATNSAESFIDNISLEYRLDGTGTRYVRVFHNKNYESILDGEITETGVGLVLRKKMDRLGELFIFRRKKKLEEMR